jgi:protein O-mannosyl-transferase
MATRKEDKKKKKTEAQKKTASSTDKKFIVKAAFFIALFSFLLYANTIKHGFVLDDASVLKENKLTQQGSSAIGKIFHSAYRYGYNDDVTLYRPLSKAMFAVEWQLSPDNPQIHHVINILLYAIVCALLFFLLYKLTRINPYLLLISALLFAAHPIHTEVAANIKSRDEILAMFFLLLSLNAVLNYLENKKILSLILSLAFFFLGLLSKESAIIFLAIVPLCIYFFRDLDLKENIRFSAIFVVVAGVYILIHKSVLGAIGISNVSMMDNSLMASTSFIEQKMTAILILGKYLLLLLFPHPLSSDYSFNTIPIVGSFANAGFLISLLALLGLLLYAVKNFAKKDLFSFCILFFFISMAITSNIFVIIGTHMAERLLFFPSVAFCLGLVLLICKIMKIDIYDPALNIFRNAKPLLYISGLVLLLFSVKTFSRNKDWKSNVSLFTKDVQTVPNSAHMLMYVTDFLVDGDSLKTLSPEVKEKHLAEARRDIDKALQISWLFPDAHFLSGRIWYEQKNYDSALVSFNRASGMNPSKPKYHNNAGTCYFSLGRFAEAAQEFEKAEELEPDKADHPFNLGSAYGALGENYKLKNDPANATKYFKLAIDKFQRTVQLDPKYKSAYQFMGITYMSLGDSINGKANLERAAGL